MRQRNRKNAKGEENTSAANVEKADKERIKELAKKKKEMQEELDELKGHTAKGKAASVLVFFLLTGLLLGTFVGIVKLDIGGVASKALAPVISDVPVLRGILPVGMQKENASELAAKKLQAKEKRAAAKAQKAQAKADAKAAAKAKAAADRQAKADAKAEEEAEAQAQAEADAEAAEEEQEQAEAEKEAALQDYVKTYSAMKPKDAAKVFDSMMPDQEGLIARILENLTPDQRAAILSKMSVANAAVLTEKMRQ